jgi:hypothetical protein
MLVTLAAPSAFALDGLYISDLKIVCDATSLHPLPEGVDPAIKPLILRDELRPRLRTAEALSLLSLLIFSDRPDQLEALAAHLRSNARSAGLEACPFAPLLEESAAYLRKRKSRGPPPAAPTAVVEGDLSPVLVDAVIWIDKGRNVCRGPTPTQDVEFTFVVSSNGAVSAVSVIPADEKCAAALGRVAFPGADRSSKVSVKYRF